MTQQFRPGDEVVFTRLPPKFVDDLPQSDQNAIRDVMGKRVLLVGYDDIGRAELQFKDREGIIHFIYLAPEFLGRPE